MSRGRKGHRGKIIRASPRSGACTMPVLKHTACPVCPSSDAYCLYADGGSHCFSCGYHKAANGVTRLQNSLAAPPAPRRRARRLYGPLSPAAEAWLDRYQLLPEEKALFRYDVERQQLVYQFGDFTNARCFAEDAATKYISEGPKPFQVIYGPNLDLLVLVEDIVSAIKVARHAPSMAMFGSSIPTNVDIVAPVVCLWYDWDKLGESIRMSKALTERGQQTKVISSPLDPKEYNDQEIREWIGL